MFMHKSLERDSVGAAVSNQCFFQADYQIKHEIRALRWTAYVVNTSFHSVHTLYYINLYPSNQAQFLRMNIKAHLQQLQDTSPLPTIMLPAEK